MKTRFDIDIDVKTTTNRSDFGVRGMIYNEDAGKVQPHPSAVYLDDVPVDSLTGNAAMSYKELDALGCHKVDLLSNSSYNIFESKQEVLELYQKEPDWSLLTDKRFVSELPHVGNNFDAMQQIKPKSVEELADFLAIIRPGKAHMLERYRKETKRIRRVLYTRPKDGMYFKKSHAIAYALMIVAVMNKKSQTLIQWQ